MKRLIFLLFLFVFLFSFITLFAPKILSDELDDINKQINDLTSALNMSIKATRPLESELNSLQKRINDIKNRVLEIESDVAEKRKNIDKGYKDLTKQEEILNRTIRDYYIRSHYDSPLATFFSFQSASEITQILAYQKAAADQDKAIITNIAITISDLEEKKKTLEIEQTRLAQLKTTLDEQSKKLDEVVSGAKAYQQKLSSQIAQLSAKQQDIISQRLASLGIPRSAGAGVPACIDDREKDPGFSPRLAFFTYGVPNRVGLSQYGAFGRSRAGQNAEDILRTYYTNYELKKDYSQDISINVDGFGSFKIEDYLKHLGEMPESWGNEGGFEAQKAQAIAARSYALAYTNNGSGTICPTDRCQVFLANEKGGKWNEAVEITKGWVMIEGGNPIKAWYSSTHGGYIKSSGDIGWNGTSFTKNAKDTTSDSINSFDDLRNNAYDGPSHANSPWFYCDWGSRNQYNKTAWLKPDEVADIVNIILLARVDSSAKDHLYQTDKPHPYGGEVWDANRVKQELLSRNITPYNNVSDVSVSPDFGSGKISTINLSGDAGSTSFNGSEFKDWFNLRAPANIQIVGPLYNVERR
ncbi:MAG: hypothetical protein HYV37_00420 [Candidatus Levyibacteriota bacterium]|nr:MAG: hypothetical protein HYV37_00420 [Candidatus Levybacteria bacterium]